MNRFDESSNMTTVLLWTFVAACVYVTMAWIVSLVAGRISVIDAFWGPGFVVIAGTSWLLRTKIASTDDYVLIGLVTLWATRLAVHLGIRIAGESHEDRRYASIRSKYEPHFWIKSLAIVFLLQGVIMWLVALPVTFGLSIDVAPSMAMLSAGVAVWAIGVFFEAVGDYQLAAFRRDTANQGKVLSTGLWGLTRHPNYFGDFAVWWGLWLVSAASGAPLWTAISPAVMSLFLLKVSGVTLLERDIQERRPAYAEYVRRTSAFFPWWPKGAAGEESR